MDFKSCCIFSDNGIERLKCHIDRDGELNCDEDTLDALNKLRSLGKAFYILRNPAALFSGFRSCPLGGDSFAWPPPFSLSDIGSPLQR
jgi:hypothetical protein